MARVSEVLVWICRRERDRLERTLGWPRVISALSLIAALAAGAVAFADRHALSQARAQLDEVRDHASLNPSSPAAPADDARSRVADFDARLLARDDLSTVVQDLILLADEEGLVLARAEYRPQADSTGGFLRYRMSMPVKGDAKAVRRFMAAALKKQPMLALESVQFHRDQADAKEVEARIQWSVLARLQAGTAL